MILYDYWRSTSAWRVRLGLHLKELPFERRAVNIAPDAGEQKTPDFQALNPFGQVPVLVVDDGAGGTRSLTQSMAILTFLEERYPEKPLLPADLWLRARVRQLAEMVNAGIQPLQNQHTQEIVRALGADAAAWTQHFIARGLEAIEAVARETAGKFLVGDAISLADLFLVPQLYSARRVSLDPTPYPTLLRVESACAALPAFAAALPAAQTDAPGAAAPAAAGGPEADLKAKA